MRRRHNVTISLLPRAGKTGYGKRKKNLPRRTRRVCNFVVNSSPTPPQRRRGEKVDLKL
jgi:hypothetical protein